MPASVLAVWLDAAEPRLLEEMMAAGQLPTLASLRRRGSYGRLRAPEFSVPECSYAMVLTGQPPDRTGTWLVGKFDPRTYSLSSDGLGDFCGVPLFLPCDGRYRVATFDVPQLPLLTKLNGVQVLSWGAHSPQVPAGSSPPELSDELIIRHGRHPAGPDSDHACLDDPHELRDLYERTLRGIEMRAHITCDLLRREQWDLFLTAFGEPHVGGHMFWPHPACLEALKGIGGAEAIRTIYRAIDRLLGRVVTTAGPTARCVVFSPEGMQHNTFDLGSMVFLAEYLFRYSFAGLVGVDFRDPHFPPSPESQAGIKNWVMELWHRRHRATPLTMWLWGKLPASCAMTLCRWFGKSPPLAHPYTRDFWSWQPTMWYQPYWPYMKAFALVSNSDGFIRLNVQGREQQGRVAPRRYDHTCGEITDWLLELRDPETARPVVERVYRTRSSPNQDERASHGADLVVKWNSALRNRIESPRFGGLGPVPYHRAGAHTADGFLCASGPGIPAGQSLATGSLLDVAPTILQLMGVPCPRELSGRPLISVGDIRRAE